MRIIYGQRGQPVASIDGNAMFTTTGDQFAFTHDDHIYKVDGGEWIGSMAGGVVYNAYGAPQGFEDGCMDGLPPAPPSVQAMVPPKLLAIGENITSYAAQRIPEFLLSRSRGNREYVGRDGYFA